MPTIVNTYRAPSTSVADGLAGIGNSIFGPGALQADLYRKRAAGLELDNNARIGIADLARRGGLDLNSPDAQALLLSSENPQRVLEGLRGIASITKGATSPEAANAFQGAGGSYASTGAGVREGEANKLHIADLQSQRSANSAIAVADNTPVSVLDPSNPNGIVTVSRRDAIQRGLTIVPNASEAEGYGKLRVLNTGPGTMTPEQLKASGAQPTNSTPHNYLGPNGEKLQTYDGRTDLTGRPLPPGGMIASAQGSPDQFGLRPSVSADMQKQDIALQKLQSVSEYARSLIQPNNVGIPGMVKGLAQDATQIAGGVANAFGYTGLNDALADAKARAVTGGVNGDTLNALFNFDPKLPQLGTAYYALVMTAADAIAGGTSKASDKDVALIKNMLGDPNSLFANPEYLNAKVDAMNEVIGRLHSVNAPAMQNAPQPPAAAAVPAPQQAPAPTAPQAPAQPNLRIDINGNVLQ